MIWFEGSIPAAINLAKQRSSIFVVVITSGDEQSNQLLANWEDDRVSEAAQRCCVAIKVDAKSEPCVQFSQIYPVVCIPSSFFIGEKGIPLEVIAGCVSAEELVKRLDRVKQMHAQQIGGGNVFPEAGGLTDTSPPDAVAPAAEPAAAADQTEDEAPGASAEAEENLDEKVERLTKKLEERREQRKKGEEENEIKKEMERRKVGKDVQDVKRKREEEKSKQLLEERNREKAEEKAARARVKQQIAQDRADRASRYAQAQEEKEAQRLALLQARQAEQEARKEALARERSCVARIQLRLPDGSSFTNQFPCESRLQEVRAFAAREVAGRYGVFSLATMFPRREFSSEDLERSLLELELVPSASIVLLPQSSRPANAVLRPSDGGVWAVLGTLLYPLLAVWRFLSSFLFAAPPPVGAAPPPRASQTTSYTTSPAGPPAERQTTSSADKRPKDFQKDGKVCRLRTQDDSEDDNNTWNGNSTQQM